MTCLLLLVTLLALTNGEPTVRRVFPEHDRRIIGGNTTVIELHPYAVSILLGGEFSCGGSIISSKYIVTAGHCAQDKPYRYHIRSGSSFTNVGGSLHRVVKVVSHEEFGINTYGVPEYDVAVMKVAEPFHFDQTRRPVQLFRATDKFKPGSTAVITGWGIIDTSTDKVATQLQAVELPMINTKLCAEAYKSLGGISKGQICASFYGVGGKDACSGDSGGPLTIGGRLAGIVSWALGCATPFLPGVYTDITKVRDWIINHTKY